MRKTILLANNNTIVSQTISSMLRMHPDYKVIGVCNNGVEAQNFILSNKPHLAILDESLEMGSGHSVAKHLKDIGVDTKLTLLTMNGDKEKMREAIECGVVGYFSITKITKQMLSCLDTICSNKYFIDKDLYLAKRRTAYN